MAENYGCIKANEIMGKILETLQEYEKQTDTMINADLETLQQVLITRNEFIEELEELRSQLDGVVQLEADEERALLEGLLCKRSA